MKYAVLFLALALHAQVQITPGKTIQASAGQLTCAGIPTFNQGIAAMRITCMSEGAVIHTSVSVVPPNPGTGVVVNVSSGPNSITWLLTRGNKVPDGWQVAATDGQKTESRSGVF